MNKDNKIFAGTISQKINNNNTTYTSINQIADNPTNDNRNISQKINDIFMSKNYIYKADVVIYTRTETLRKRLIGRNNLHLITDKNELIPISEIVDIKYQ